MKYRSAAICIAVAAVPLAWFGYCATSAAVLPFANGISIRAASDTATAATLLARSAAGTYVSLQVDVAPPYAVLSTDTLNQLLSGGGWKSLLAQAAGPAGAGRQSQALAFADLTGNGLLGAAYASNASVYLYQLSSGTPARFTGTIYQVGQDVNSLAFADFNGDGKPDLAVAYDGAGAPGGIAILLGKGDGTLASPITYGSGVQATRFVAFDLNHDGALDIASWSLDGTVAVLLGKGDGTFGPATRYTVTGASQQAIAAADFNGDGVPDLVVGGATGILLGNGNGTFRPGPALPAGAASSYIWSFAAGDLNGDGKMDLAYADINSQLVAPLYGNGDGTFRAGQTYVVSLLPDTLVLADYNNDGRLDIIHAQGDARLLVPSNNSGNIDILLNNADGTFQGAPTYVGQQASGVPVPQKGVSAGKFGGAFTGIVSTGPSGLVLLPGDGKGGLLSAQTVTSNALGPNVAADFNGDGKPDIAALMPGSPGSVLIFLGTAGGLAAPSNVTTGQSFPVALAAADFDGDGKSDLVVMSSGTPAGSLVFLKGNGDGTFRAPLSISAGATPTSVLAADLNGDGKPDIVFADSGVNGSNGGVYVALNLGGGNFQAPAKLFSGTYPTVGVGDVNRDGKPDLVASDQNTVSWLAGNGNGTFQAPVAIATSDAPDSGVLVQDFNGDGNPDIVLAHMATDATFLAGNGNGTFSAEVHFPGAAQPTQLLSADMNGDGKPDLIVGGFTISVLLNQSGGPGPSGVSPASGSAASQPFTFAFADPRGYSDLGVVNILINNFLDGRRACYLAYSQPSNVLYLVGDDGGTLLGGSVLTASGSISNSQCTVSSGGAPVTAGGNALSLALNIAFTTSFGGNKVVYTAAGDVSQNNSGWQARGVWQAPGAAQTGTIAVVGMIPASGTGSAATQYTFSFSDTKGNQDLGVANILINNFIDGRHACYLAYARSANTLYLVDDAGDAGGPFAGSAVLSAPGTLQNSQCTVSWGAAPLSVNGNNLSLILNIAFTPAFDGYRVFYLAARDGNGLNNTDWQALGAWAVQ